MIDVRRTALLLLWACSTCGCSTDGVGLGRADPGTGTGTLLVEAAASDQSGEDVTELSVRIRKGGVDVDGAKVNIVSDLGLVDLRAQGGGNYAATQAGWATSYVLHISVFDGTGLQTDGLDGSVLTPARVEMNVDTTKPFDPHTLPNQALILSWMGPAADQAVVRTKDFGPVPLVPDPLTIAIPAQSFQDDEQKLSITRENSVALAGGQPGSTFSARYRFETMLTVVNPY
jgi:hypothetical protein